ncbi:MAG: hypothetical protein QM831_03390 [Kofleriaceae bacterium]
MKLFFASLVLFLLSSSISHAQAVHYDPLRFDSGLIGIYAPGDGRGGFGASEELKFNVHDQVAVGLRAEASVQFGGNINTGNGDTSISIGAVAALMAKGEYFFVPRGSVRPFAGLMLGIYDIAGESVDASNNGNTSIDQKAGRYFGIAPQIGIDLGRVRFAVAYNAMIGASIEVEQQVTTGGEPTHTSYSQNYFSFEMSLRFGGREHAALDPNTYTPNAF